MRFILCFAACLALAACSTVAPADAWTWDGTQPLPKASVPAAELSALTNRIAQLQIQRTEIRNAISAERDAWGRQGLYAQLHEVGMQLSPLERQLSRIAPAR